MSPDGARLYVAAGGADRVFVLDARSGGVLAEVPVGGRPWGLALAAGLLYTANGRTNDVSVVDPTELRELRRIPVGSRPWGVAVSGAR